MVDIPTTRWFSDSLRKIHTALDESTLERTLRTALAEFSRLNPRAASSARRKRLEIWLHGLLQQAAGDARARLNIAAKPPLVSRSLKALTRREHEVLQLITCGCTDAEIGRTLGIAPKTASKHVENILRKLCVETRTAAAAMALAEGDAKSG